MTDTGPRSDERATASGRYDVRDAKRRNELASATLLARHLSALGELSADPRLGDPNRGEPDTVCTSPDGERGIEVTNVFYDEEHASWTWGLAIEADGGAAPGRVRGEPVVVRGVVIGEMAPLLVNPHVKLAEATQRLLEQKCAKRYAMPTYLMLDGRQAVIVTAADAPRVLELLSLPESCNLLGAFLCLLESGSPRFFKVAKPAATSA